VGEGAGGSQSQENPAITLLASPAGTRIINTIARRLQSTFHDLTDYREYRGWSQLGATQAARDFDPDRLHGETLDMEKRVASYLIYMGRRRAINEMRSAGVIGRPRGDGPHTPPRSIKTTNLTNEHPEPITPPSTVAKAIEQRDTIDHLLSILNSQERTLIESAHIHDMTIVQAGRVAHVAENQVYTTHNRAIGKMKAHYQRHQLAGAVQPVPSTPAAMAVVTLQKITVGIRECDELIVHLQRGIRIYSRIVGIVPDMESFIDERSAMVEELRGIKKRLVKLAA